MEGGGREYLSPSRPRDAGRTDGRCAGSDCGRDAASAASREEARPRGRRRGKRMRASKPDPTSGGQAVGQEGMRGCVAGSLPGSVGAGDRDDVIFRASASPLQERASRGHGASARSRRCEPSGVHAASPCSASGISGRRQEMSHGRDPLCWCVRECAGPAAKDRKACNRFLVRSVGRTALLLSPSPYSTLLYPPARPFSIPASSSSPHV